MGDTCREVRQDGAYTGNLGKFKGRARPSHGVREGFLEENELCNLSQEVKTRSKEYTKSEQIPER